jgi:hypothetical protein
LITEEEVVSVELYGQGETEIREVKPVPVLFTRKLHMDRPGIEYDLRCDRPVTSRLRHDMACEYDNVLFFHPRKIESTNTKTFHPITGHEGQEV